MSVDLTSDLAEYGKEESAESTRCGRGGGGVLCAYVCRRERVYVCVLFSMWVVRGEGARVCARAFSLSVSMPVCMCVVSKKKGRRSSQWKRDEQQGGQ